MIVLALRTAILGLVLWGGPGLADSPLEAGKCRLRVSVHMDDGEESPLCGLTFVLNLPPGVTIPTVDDTGRVRDSALVPKSREGSVLLASGNFNANMGTLAIAMAGSMAARGDILALELEVPPGTALTLQDLNRNLVVTKAGGVDTSEYRSVDLTNQVKVQIRVPRGKPRLESYGVPIPGDPHERKLF